MIDYLKPEQLRIETAPDGTLRAQVEGDRCAIRVEVLRAFPLSNANSDLVLRDGGGKEIGILENLEVVEAGERQLLQKSIDNRYFLPKILKINSIYERFGSAVWEVETDRGDTSITTKAMHEALYEITPSRYLVRDTEENRYEIPDVNALDDESKARFMGKV